MRVKFESGDEVFSALLEIRHLSGSAWPDELTGFLTSCTPEMVKAIDRIRTDAMSGTPLPDPGEVRALSRAFRMFLAAVDEHGWDK